jgi:hypothetical protein
MPDPLVWTASALVVATFLWAAAAKVVSFRNWRRALGGYGIPFPGRLEDVAAAAVPVVELGAATTILFVSVKGGAALSLSLLALFCAAILRARTTAGDRLPCGCFGRNEERDYRALLARNALLGAACGVALLGSQKGDLVSGVEAPSGSEILPLVLVGAGVVVALWTVRQAMGSMRRREHP